MMFFKKRTALRSFFYMS